MSGVIETGGIGMGVRVLLALTVAVIVSVFAGVAQGAVVPSPAWKVVAATGPTVLAPTQSEVQQVTVGAEGGEYALAYKSSGTGTLRVGAGRLKLVLKNTVATIVEGSYKVGELVRALGLPATATIVSCSSDCVTPGSTLTLSAEPTSTKERAVTTFSKEVIAVSGTFHAGDAITGQGLVAGTTVTSVGAGTLMLSAFPIEATAGGAVALTATETTSPVAFDASPQTLQTALEGLPAIGSGNVTVSGGLGGGPEHPYLLEFGGSLAEQDIAQLTANGEALTGTVRYASVSTTVPGGPGTGEIAVYPENIGSEPSNGTITVHIGPLPAGVAITATGGVESKGWSCATSEQEATCTSSTVVNALTPAQPFGVPVAVRQATGLHASAEVTVSDEHGDHASYQMPIVISAQPARPGFAGFWTNAFEADGTPSTQAGAHPYSDITWFLVNTIRAGSGQIVPAGDLKAVNADLTPGFIGDPMIVSRCPQALLAAAQTEELSGCNHKESAVGVLGPGTTFTLGEALPSEFIDDVPVAGSAAEFSALFAAPMATLLGSVRTSEDFGVTVSSPSTPSTVKKTYFASTGFEGFPKAGGGKAFFRNATDCGEQARQAPVESLEASTWQEPASFSKSAQSLAPVTGCDQLEFKAYDPATKTGQVAFGFQPSSTTGSTGVGATAHLHIDQSGLTDPSKLGTPDLKQSVVTLPEGFDVNPSQAAGLASCSEAQVGYLGEGALPNPTRFDNTPVSCPDASKLGTVEVSTPLLEEKLDGTIYLAAQEENPFHSLIALYLVIESPRFGITLKLPGKVETNATTGQITATFDYVPQQPVEDLTLHFRGGGGRSEFATPEVCGTYSTKGVWTPWSAPESGPPAETEDPFTVSTGCSASLAARPFSPAFEAGTVTPTAGAYSPLVIKLVRNDGEQELSRFDVTLPEGLVGKLAGMPKCSDGQIAAAMATGRTGRQEQAAPSCPVGSQIGTLDTTAGVGAEPIHVPGKAYLAGAYEGAPLSVVTITPALAGPFDLGVVVVRAPLFIDQATAQVTAKSDAIPTILRGIPLKVRSVTISIDRPGFSLNPTSCEVTSITGSAAGSSGASHVLTNRFQVGGCSNLSFDPVFSAGTQAKASANGNGASLTVSVGFHPGEANIHKVEVKLPKLLPSRLSTLQKACTEQVFATNPAACPVESNVGTATAVTPILTEPLHGPAYLVSHGGAAFPDLEIVLQSEGITLILDGKTEIKNAITTSRFETVPDAPVSSFKLELPESPHSALGVPRGSNLCYQPLVMPTLLIAQNGKGIQQNTQIQVSECPYALKIVKHTVKKQAATLSVYVPQAGKLTATATGLNQTSKTVKNRQAVTLTLKQRTAGTLNTKVLIRFTPNTGKQRHILHTTIQLKFH